MQCTQNKIIRLMVNAPWRFHVGDNEFKRVGLLPIEPRVEQLMLGNMFNIVNGNAPTYVFGTVFDVCNNSSVPMLQESADILTDWSRNNDMRINATMVICFCRNDNHVASIPRIVIDDNDIARVTQAKGLGVTLSSDLTWNAHVDTIVSKGAATLYDSLVRSLAIALYFGQS